MYTITVAVHFSLNDSFTHHEVIQDIPSVYLTYSALSYSTNSLVWTSAICTAACFVDGILTFLWAKCLFFNQAASVCGSWFCVSIFCQWSITWHSSPDRLVLLDQPYKCYMIASFCMVYTSGQILVLGGSLVCVLGVHLSGFRQQCLLPPGVSYSLWVVTITCETQILSTSWLSHLETGFVS